MPLSFKRCLVLGSNSFTGSHFISYLLKNTSCEVVGISRSEEYPRPFLPYLNGSKRPERYTFHRLDLNDEMEKLETICDDFEPELVVNFAAQGEVRNSWKWPEQWYRTNCLGVVRLAEFLRSGKYLKRYVAVSTPEVYGATGENIAETHHYYPSTPYGASKLAGDLHLFALQKRYDFPVVFTRAANLYGIHQQLYRIIPRTVIYLKLGKEITLHARGEARRAFIHARDVAELTFRAATDGRNGQVYHVAPENGQRSIADVVRFICKLTDHDFESSVRLVDENFGQDGVFSLSAAKAREELGWRPKVDFETGVREVVDWVDENWEFLRNQPLEYLHKA